MITSPLANQVRITRELRAYVIEWLFECGEKILILDKTILFQAVNLMDRWYQTRTNDAATRDLQLTAVTALFIASKNIEVEPIDMRMCMKTLCFNKYSRENFLKKEAGIRRACGYENEAPSCVDFVTVYVRLLQV